MMNYSIFVIDDEDVAREGVTMALKSDYEVHLRHFRNTRF